MANTNSTMMDLDFTNVESFAYIPVGEHVVSVKDALFKKATTGTDQLEINFEDANGATRKARYSLVPQALWKVKQVLEALGIPCEGRIRLNAKNIVGKRCVIIVENDANDPNRQIVTSVNKIAGAAPEMPPFLQNQFVTPAPQQAPASPAPAVMETPSTTPFSPSEPAQPEPQGNMPPWMQNAQNNAPQGNLPPWMRPKQ